MKTFVTVTCLLAAVAVVRGMDQETIITKYMEYLMPDVKPCADEYHITEEHVSNIQKAETGADQAAMMQMGCMKACVMKRMKILTSGNEFHLEPIFTMIDTVHAGEEEDIKLVKTIATDCLADIQGENDECKIGHKYTDCYIQKLFT